ncbi:hypothetical protein BaRGS_00002770 [Batillaria attramentaria]|uniref:Uncharacterized protein n=1 Tax=Batillaria attramentaria TaxID=370345 RepID=A0ABD0M2Y4_9CAEN
MNAVRQLWAIRGPFITLFMLIVLLPLALSDYASTRCAYVLLVMAVMWLTEAIPISATALMPIVLFPMCGVMKASDVSKSYVNDTSMLFLGGLVLAVAVEEWRLHKRIALAVLRIVGADPKFVMLGLLLPTWFLSMWISNTATASMMIPIANAVLTQMADVKGEDGGNSAIPMKERKKTTQGDSQPVQERYIYRGDSTEENKITEPENKGGETLNDITDPAKQSNGLQIRVPSLTNANEAEMGVAAAADDTDPDKWEEENSAGSKDYRLLCKGLTLCVAYGCNIGGIATLTGTPPNLVFKGQADTFFNLRYEQLGLPKQGSGISFANWMGMALPMSIITLFLAWILLMILFLRRNIFRKVPAEKKERVKAVIMSEWKSMGRFTMAEAEVTALFIFLAIMWISRDPKESPGWAVWFMPGYVSDSSAAMLVAVLLFLLPSEIPRVFCLRKAEHVAAPFYRPLLTWEQVNRKLPWGVIILLGGGFALAKACLESGLSEWLGDELASLSDLEPWHLNLILCIIVAIATEVTSNTATSTLLMPIMYEMSLNANLNPLYLMASAAVATSFAFMLPVATPPNAIVFSYGHLRVFEMAFAGLFMNAIAVLMLTLAVNTWGGAVLGFKTVPAIFQDLSNVTQST